MIKFFTETYFRATLEFIVWDRKGFYNYNYFSLIFCKFIVAKGFYTVTLLLRDLSYSTNF